MKEPGQFLHQVLHNVRLVAQLLESPGEASLGYSPTEHGAWSTGTGHLRCAVDHGERCCPRRPALRRP